ncbi:MAG: aldolase/citrate lyase family protein [Candidatus Latescibacterota bacterium]|nr:aldolase/citrate lyase family protein [Candidatus Latescibacterota bacterium]
MKSKLQAGQVVLGSGLPAPSPHVAGAILDTGIDFLWIDTEHMPYASESVDTIPVLARMRGVAPMIRVAHNDPGLIKKAYDIGAVAVMVPQVNSAEEAARAVDYARYPPEGTRGLSPMWTKIAGENWDEVILSANEETILIVQMESRQSWDNLDEIAAVPGVDIILVGPLDLSASLGVPTQTNSREVQTLMEEVPKRLERTGVTAGTTLVDVAEIQQKISWGYRFLNVGNALTYGVDAVAANVRTLRDNPTGG